MSVFQTAVYAAVTRIPRGKVASYGQIAQMAGYSGSARAVGNMLHRNTKPDEIPCYRVVRSDGRLATGYAYGGMEAQKQRLERDGIVVANYCVDMNKYGFNEPVELTEHVC